MRPRHPFQQTGRLVVFGLIMLSLARDGASAATTGQGDVVFGMAEAAATASTDNSAFEGDPDWSQVKPLAEQNAEAIVFIQDGDIWVIYPDGQGEVRLTTGGSYHEPTWSPDGEWIAYVQHLQINEKPAFQIGLLNAMTRAETVLVGPEHLLLGPVENYYSFSAPDWAPDGKRLFFVASDGRIQGQFLRSLDLASGQQNEFLLSQVRGFAVADDGLIAYKTFSNAPPNEGNGIALANIAGNEFGTLLPIENGTSIGDMCWDNEGNRLIFVKNRWMEEYNAVEWMAADGGAQGVLFEFDAGRLACAPGGGRLAYAVDEFIHIYDPEFGVMVPLTAGDQPDWGRTLVISQDDQCGSWQRAEPLLEKDLRIEAVPIFSQPPEDCQGAFRLENTTDFYGFGGYSFELNWQSGNATTSWIPEGDQIILFPFLNIEVHNTPLEPNADAQVNIQGQFSLKSFSYDLSFFLARTALELVPLPVSCVVPEEQLLFAAVRVANIILTSANLALEGEYGAARDEFLQVAEEFYNQLGEALIEVGYDCASDALKTLALKPVLIFKIGLAYLTWIPKFIWDYFYFDGLPAEVSLVYSAIPETGVSIVVGSWVGEVTTYGEHAEAETQEKRFIIHAECGEGVLACLAVPGIPEPRFATIPYDPAYPPFSPFPDQTGDFYCFVLYTETDFEEYWACFLPQDEFLHYTGGGPLWAENGILSRQE